MWHHTSVTVAACRRWRSRWALSLGLLCAAGAVAQSTGNGGSPGAVPSSHKEKGAAELASLLSAQQDAVASGNAGAIEERSKALNAYTLREFAKLRSVEGNGREAVRLYRASLALLEGSGPDAADEVAETRLELASTLLRMGDGAGAAAETERVVEARPGSAQAWAVRGSALRVAHQEAAAAEAFGRSLTLRPDPSIAYALGSTLLAAHDKAKAEQIFQQILKNAKGDAIWYVAIGDAYRENGYFSEAVTAFQTALQHDPRVPHAEFFLGYTYLQMNQWGPSSQSFEHLRAAVRQAPREYVSNFYLGALESTDGSDLASSDRHLLAAAAADATQPEVWIYLGLNANRRQDATHARQYLEKAIALTGADEARNNYQVRRAYFALGRILIAEGDRAGGDALLAKYKRTEQASVAESSAQIAQKMGPNGGEVHALSSLPAPAIAPPISPSGDGTAEHAAEVATMQAMPANERQRLANTEAELRKILASSYNDLGTAEARQQRYGAALTDFQSAEQWQPENATVLRNVGVAAFRTQEFAVAKPALEAFLKSAPGDGRSRVMLAMAEFSMGQFAPAAKSFDLAPELVMKDPRAAYSWAFSLARTGQQQHANEIATTLMTAGLPPEAVDLVCHVFLDTEAYEQSLQCFKQVTAADGAIKLAHYGAGESLIRLDRPAEAIPELRQELALSPGNANVESSLAFALLQTSAKTEARGLLESAVAADPSHARAQYQLGKLLLDEGDVAGALPHLEAAERSDPSPDYVHYQLQVAYRKLGRVADADREMGVYREIKARARSAATVPAR